MPSERTDEEVYWLVRRAVEDALWDVLGTALLSVVYAVVFLVGVRVLAALLFQSRPEPTLGGLALAAVGVLLVVLPVAGMLRLWDLQPFGGGAS